MPPKLSGISEHPKDLQRRRLPQALRLASVTLTIIARTVGDAQAGPPFAELGGDGAKPIVTFHAKGTQVYDCQRREDGVPAWHFVEPKAALFLEGKLVGHHFAGPTWQLSDGDAVVGKVVARAPGATATDVPLLKLEVVARKGRGPLTTALSIQRLDTHGGVLSGPCASIGAIREVPYTADYVFSRSS